MDGGGSDATIQTLPLTNRSTQKERDVARAINTLIVTYLSKLRQGVMLPAHHMGHVVLTVVMKVTLAENVLQKS